MNTLSAMETAKILGVSGATIRNWTRAGHITPVAIRPLTFDYNDVIQLRDSIRSNRFNRLRKRANKTASDKLDHSEISDPRIATDFEHFLELMETSPVTPAKAIYLATLFFLQSRDECTLPAIASTLNFHDIVWKRPVVKDIMHGWLKHIGENIPAPHQEAIDAFLEWNNTDDPLGLLYQGLSSIGRRSRTGAYLTPGHIIDASLEEFDAAPASFLDPCCGTGRYLMRAARRFRIDPNRLYGFDTDPVAVDIARLNLLLAYGDIAFTPHVRCLDSLRDLATGEVECDTNHLLESFDAIATNPPWGGCKNQTRHKNLVAHVRSGESFSLFLEKSLRLLAPGGRLSFILPESMLKIRAHADIRRIILENTCIKKVTLLGRVFAGVFTPIIRLDLIKQPAPDDWSVTVCQKDRAHTTSQKRFHANANLAFDITVTENDAMLMEKIFAVPHQTLKNNADWALGIVTGDNGRYVLDTPVPGSEPVLRGRDVFRFVAREPRSHIVFKPEEFQQVAPERFFRAPEKLVYRFVSERLIFAYDTGGTLTLNSANIVIPRLPGLSIKVVLAFLNSRLFQYVFLKRFQTRKILRGDLETLPFPFLPADRAAHIEGLVNKCLAGNDASDELDTAVFSAFSLNSAEVAELEAGLQSDTTRVIV